MAIEYSFTASPAKKEKDWGMITFSTSTPELYDAVYSYILLVTDAMRWRNRVQEVKFCDGTGVSKK